MSSGLDQILIIGNGKSVLDKEYGRIIDSGPWWTCRFNNFQTDGYEKYIGSHTHYLCRRACDDVRLWDSKELLKVFTFVTYCKWSAGMLRVADQINSYYGTKSEVVGLTKCKAIGEDIGLDQPQNEWASCGILALDYLTKRFGCDRILVYGFDPPESKSTHYFPKKPKDSCYHNWQKEWEFYRSLNLTTLEETLNA